MILLIAWDYFRAEMDCFMYMLTGRILKGNNKTRSRERSHAIPHALVFGIEMLIGGNNHEARENDM